MDDESFDVGFCPRCGDEVEHEGHLLCSGCEDDDAFDAAWTDAATGKDGQ